MDSIIKTIKPLEKPSLLIKGISETMKNEGKEQKWGFFCMLLGTLGAILLRNMLAIKRPMSTRACKQTIGASKGTVRNSQDV